MSEANKPTPIKRFSIGWSTAAVWKNEGKEGRPFYGVTFQRGYKDEKTDTIKNSDSFNRGDLLEVAKLADQAHTFINRLEFEDRQKAKAAKASSEAPPASDDDVPF